MHGPHCNRKMRLFVFFGIWIFVFHRGCKTPQFCSPNKYVSKVPQKVHESSIKLNEMPWEKNLLDGDGKSSLNL